MLFFQKDPIDKRSLTHRPSGMTSYTTISDVHVSENFAALTFTGDRGGLLYHEKLGLLQVYGEPVEFKIEGERIQVTTAQTKKVFESNGANSTLVDFDKEGHILKKDYLAKNLEADRAKYPESLVIPIPLNNSPF